MTLYAIAELCSVTGKDGSFEEENEDEPVVCIHLGLFHNMSKADKKAYALNKPFHDENEDDRFAVVGLEVKG